MDTCKNCDHHRIKEILTKNNALLKKDYCRRFEQELTSLKTCSRFEEKEKPSTIFAILAIFSIALSFAGVIATIIEAFEGWEDSLWWVIIGSIFFFGLGCLFAYLDER